MGFSIEISGTQVVGRLDGEKTASLGVRDFVTGFLSRVESPPSNEAIPEGLRFGWRRGDFLVLVLEEKPALRTVRWLANDSPAPFGRRAKYRTVRLAFPFVVLVVTLCGGELTGHQQAFYRTAPLRRLSDELLLPNLRNVARAYEQDAWLCLAHLHGRLAPLNWYEKIDTIWQHVMNAGFNGSSEHHEGMSYFGEMQSLDPRIASVEAWEQASLADRYFPLQVPWRPVGKSVGTVMEESLRRVAPPFDPASAEDLLPLLAAPAGKRRARWKLFG